ncbi:hypothetical protein [Glaciibacter psychrotolerans]|uniref:Uncharacterized protein n=1 Tax=Glaciibacter psychrotolerans TaxID=670054 RepID=A0A7Z0EG22_9MICO|nr:hypothetical protein [Leifsonia psychrotolerans]NYJ20267.1 hypothetical protein [Leifsonia psychrotolerans]
MDRWLARIRLRTLSAFDDNGNRTEDAGPDLENVTVIVAGSNHALRVPRAGAGAEPHCDFAL